MGKLPYEARKILRSTSPAQKNKTYEGSSAQYWQCSRRQLSFTCFPEFINFHSRQQMIDVYSCMRTMYHFESLYIMNQYCPIRNNRGAVLGHYDVLHYIYWFALECRKASMILTAWKLGNPWFLALTSDIADLGDGERALAILGSFLRLAIHGTLTIFSHPRERTKWTQQL